jgi:iron complex outermembrane receptor protein
MYKASFAACLLASTILSVAPAHAQVADGAAPKSASSEAAPQIQAEPETGDIIVTATRRETRLQTTASAVTALTSADIQSRGIVDVQSLAALTPGMSFGTTTGAQAHISIRGVGSDSVVIGQDPRVAYYQDGVYIGRPTAQLGGVFDLERIEVLKGPQGALYGRNATGGAVNVISKAPTDQLDGYFRFGYGNYNDLTFDGAVGSGLTSNLAVRLAIHLQSRDGFGKNIVNGDDVDDKQAVGARLSLLWKPLPNLSFLTIADYNRERDHAYGTHFLGQSNPAIPILGLKLGGTAIPFSFDIASDTTPQAFIRAWGVNEKIRFDAGWANIQSTTSYRNSEASILNDYDGTSVPIYKATSYERAWQLSQELTLDGKVGRVDWLVGALYFHENLFLKTVGPVSAAIIGGAITDFRQGQRTGGTLRNDAFAPYFELAYNLTDQLALRVSGRYTTERRFINDVSSFDTTRPFLPDNPILNRPGFPRNAAVRFNNFSPSASLEWKATPNVFAYVKYSQGFKSGAYNISSIQPPFQPEKIQSYELGVKTTIPSIRGVLNLAAFYYDYTNLQVSVVRGTLSMIENAASAKIKGLDITARVEPVRGLVFEGGATYLDTHYSRYLTTDPLYPALGIQDLSGRTLTQAPKWSLNGSVQQYWLIGESKLTARAEAQYVSRVYFTPFNSPVLSQGGYTVANASLRLEVRKNWSLEAYVRNLGDKRAVAQSSSASGLWGSPVIATLIPPRTFGLRAGYSF